MKRDSSGSAQRVEACRAAVGDAACNDCFVPCIPLFRRVYVRFAAEMNATDASVKQKKEQIKRNTRNERKRKKGRNVYDRCIFMRREDATVVRAT